MFKFVVRRLAFLKYVPLLPQVFDLLFKMWNGLFRPQLNDWNDQIEAEILQIPGIELSLHKYGGTQFNYCTKELGHLHSNGLLDILTSKAVKAAYLSKGLAENHHVMPQSGWVSFYIGSIEDQQQAVLLLKEAYERARNLEMKRNLP
ncbi:hypothetical protein EHS13_30410 [Paenibacillus psychroresistens]|uniref:Luciferase domain-containing protein n=1 Tax=Paenibacillus psychroresistens TaxID=1778678 RepID=A0A6B8RTJ3_9BACL|nr:luciferase family protein [Paenibacillus psychroresistens]QGQ98885.1 hypothetical protein EHS13_30410 [Paenibacillus psychroresistens]